MYAWQQMLLGCLEMFAWLWHALLVAMLWILAGFGLELGFGFGFGFRLDSDTLAAARVPLLCPPAFCRYSHSYRR